MLSPKRSKVEIFKENSNYLRFPLDEELQTEAPNISEAATQIIKFHGSYQQDNREVRGPGGKAYQFMLRTKQPAGKVSSSLYLVMDDLADKFGVGTLRLTARQTFQLHGVLKNNLKTVMNTIIRNMGSTLGACGDLNRNILAPAVPYNTRKDYLYAQETAEKIAALLAPQAGSYYDIWVDGEKIMSADPADVIEARNDNSHGTNFQGSPEPIYGSQFLPCKFKVAVTVPTDNPVDILTNGVGFVTITDDMGEVKGFNIYMASLSQDPALENLGHTAPMSSIGGVLDVATLQALLLQMQQNMQQQQLGQQIKKVKDELESKNKTLERGDLNPYQTCQHIPPHFEVFRGGKKDCSPVVLDLPHNYQIYIRQLKPTSPDDAFKYAKLFDKLPHSKGEQSTTSDAKKKGNKQAAIANKKFKGKEKVVDTSTLTEAPPSEKTENFP